MKRDEILRYLNANSEYRANVNLLNYTDQQFSISFNDDGIVLSGKDNKKKMLYNSFKKEDIERIVDYENILLDEKS
jgi:hypothetical protein